MKKEEITTENIIDYTDLLEENAAENVGRKFYRAFGFRDESGEPCSALIYELRHSLDEDRDTEAVIHGIYGDPEGTADLLREYTKEAAGESVKETIFSFSGEEYGVREAVLTSEGFAAEKQKEHALRISVGDLTDLPLMKKKDVPSFIQGIGDLEPRAFKRGLVNCFFHARREVTEDLTALPFDWFDPELSCYAESDGRINGFLLIHKTSTGDLKVELLINVGAEAVKELAYMIRFTANRALDAYPEETRILIPCIDESSEKLSTYFFPTYERNEVFLGRRKERT
ncbi:MAG: hypothetical protein K5770_09145 [Lachnospiraceae bacterium]|nr:hypothetical protein [Lachnospiraceae bacterium]